MVKGISMKQNQRYSVLFEPVKIGPVTTKNRFYQVPHCTGLGHLRPQAEAAMRAEKLRAAGGWSAPKNLKFIRALIYRPLLHNESGTREIFLLYA